MRNAKLLALLVLGAFPMLAGNSANVTITYVPVAGTPTLSETMLIALALLLPVFAFRSLRTMGGGRGLAALIVAGGLLALEAITGYHMLPTVEATSVFTLTNPAGGTIPSTGVSSGSPQTLTNSSGVQMLLQSVTWTNLTGGLAVSTGSQYCATGRVMADTATCLLGVFFND